ncbi:MAG: ABC transporter ATP-binding protein [Chloroflexi bacterium]|nr:MAG: ABC transporter ATP-binding protein [Chloroflexota bacterium]
MTELLLVSQVGKRFQSGPRPVQALHEVTLSVSAGEFICLVGPSGSGKSTLLRIMGGLLQPDAGSVWFQGEPLTAPHAEIGFVFQKTNLMPWRTVIQNVLLPVEVQQGRAGAAERERARQLLTLMGLRDFEDSYPSQLSGGMNQRVALARALLYQPHLLLMDEPFGALDALTRERLNLELLRLHAAQARTIVMVTHDIAEAVFLADRVIVLSERPGQVMADLAIDLPRPRQISHLASPRFGELALEVRRWIGEPAVM